MNENYIVVFRVYNSFQNNLTITKNCNKSDLGSDHYKDSYYPTSRWVKHNDWEKYKLILHEIHLIKIRYQPFKSDWHVSDIIFSLDLNLLISISVLHLLSAGWVKAPWWYQVIQQETTLWSPWPSDCFDKFKAGVIRSTLVLRRIGRMPAELMRLHQSVVNQMSNWQYINPNPKNELVTLKSNLIHINVNPNNSVSRWAK